MNFLEINELANNKPRAIAFLQNGGILHNPRMCANCGHAMKMQLREKGDRWRCSRTHCKIEVGLRKDNFCVKDGGGILSWSGMVGEI